MIQVVLVDQNDVILHKARLAENAEVSRLLPALISTLRLPITDEAGRPITYHLSHNRRSLQEGETLASAGIQDGEMLVIIPEMTAGAQQDPSDPSMREPLVVLEADMQAHLPLEGFPTNYQVDAYLSDIRVWFKPGTIQNVLDRAHAHAHEEVAGILVGNVYEENGCFLVVVEDILEAQHTLSGAAFVTFTYQTWLDLLKQRDASPFIVVGWYHSHPGFGIFFSSIDEFAQKNFFSNRPWYIALVVDPTVNNWGVFALEESIIKCCVRV